METGKKNKSQENGIEMLSSEVMGNERRKLMGGQEVRGERA